MSSLTLNQTPVRTSRNFKINNIKLDNIDIPNKLDKFNNVSISDVGTKIKIDSNIENYSLKYDNSWKIKEKKDNYVSLNHKSSKSLLKIEVIDLDKE